MTNLLYIFAQYAIFFTFLISFLSKLTNLNSFRETVSTLSPLKPNWNAAIITVILLGEIIISITVLVPNATQFAFIASIVLLALLSTILAIAIRKKIRVSCNCFGESNNLISNLDIVRNVILLTIALAGLISHYYVQTQNLTITTIEQISLGIISIIFVIFVTNLSNISYIFTHQNDSVL